ncbi:MAG: hypothetical protein JSU86_06410, partial [Phycisphaerales bacterium]
GYGYAQVSSRYPGLKRWRQICRRNLTHATVALTAIGATAAFWSVWPAIAWLAAVALIITRNARRCRPRVGSTTGAILYATHQYLSKLPTVAGHLDFYVRRLLGAQRQRPIEYREAQS